MEIAVLLGGAFVVAFAVGATGFADALLASAIWLHVFPPQETVPLIFLTGIVVHALSAVHLRRALEPRRLAPFALGGWWLLRWEWQRCKPSTRDRSSRRSGLPWS